MAKEIYVVYKIDASEKLESMSVKLLHTSKKIAETFYNRNKRKFLRINPLNVERTKLIYGKINRDVEFTLDGNMLKEIIKIKESY